MAFWGQKTFCVVAGASRGIGRAISLKFSENVGPGSVFLLLARSKDALESVKQEILEGSTTSNNCKSVIATAIDLSNLNEQAFKEAVSDAFIQSGTTPKNFQHSILVQCAASLGIDKGYKVQNIQDVQYIKNYFDFNVTSFILLNSVFCELVLEKEAEVALEEEKKKTTIIHISSHGAVEPFKTWGLYCSARAAKDMLLRSISLESPNVQTINYAPGMVDTDNCKEAEKHTADPELVKYFEEQRAQGLLLTPEQTVTKLVQILSTKKFVKGEHVSYDD